MSRINEKQRGAVSIFVVIFSALLVVTISTTFARLMLQDQMQATDSDLSRSALDSANAGVEDAKRVLVKYEQECVTGSNTSCANWRDNYLNGNNCEAPRTILGTATTPTQTDGGGIKVGNDSLRQAYTCVKITLNTNNYEGTLQPGASRLVQLKSENNAAFTHVKLEWYSKKNLRNSGEPKVYLDQINELGLKPRSATAPSDAWAKNQPSLMRLQLLQFGNAFTLANFNSTDSANTNVGTLFVKPARGSGIGGVATPPPTPLTFSTEDASGPLQPIECYREFDDTSSDAYACSVTIELGRPDNPTSSDPAATMDRKDAYLRLNAPYGDETDFSVTLLNGATTVRFGGVQPLVDSTGRAADLFRRVSSRIEPGGNFPYVEGALDITGDLCKTFQVSNVTTGYDGGACPNT